MEATTKALVPAEIEEEDRNGEAADQARIEELLHRGLRPKDARRIERLERTLNLPEEEAELNRVWVAAKLRAEPKTRKKVVGEIVRCVADGEVNAYAALCRLQELEVVPERCGFARFVEGAADYFICYDDGEPVVSLKFSVLPRIGEPPEIIAKERDDPSIHSPLPE